MKLFSAIAGLLSGYLFGLATPLCKMILGNTDAFILAGLLYLGAAAAFIPFLLKNCRSEYHALMKSGKKPHIAGIIIFGGFLGPLLLMLGLKTANAASVSVWLNIELVATAMLGVMLFKDHLDRFSVIGVALTVIAGVIVSAGEQGGGIISGLFVVLACVSWSLDNHLTALVDGVSPQTITFIKGLFGGTANLLIGLTFREGGPETVIVPTALIIGMFSYGISIVLYVTSSHHLGATRSQVLFSTAPFWGIATSFALLGEAITFYVLVAALFLAAGIAFTIFASHRHEHRHQEEFHIHMHSHDDGHHGHEHPEGVLGASTHSHAHEHKEIAHSHLHYLDLHHRHDH